MRGKAKTGASRLKKGKVKKKGKLEPPDEAIDTIKKGQKKKCLTDRCFTGDTLVYTKHGYKPIKEIFKGDEVYSRDEKTGETSLKEVIETFRTTTHTVYHIWADGKEEFKTTAYHPVYVQEQGWVTAINLREGDTIETMDGFVHITKVEKTRHEEAVQVYNFHVKDWLSYFVGSIKCYVHNNNWLGYKITSEDINKIFTDKSIEHLEKIDGFDKKHGEIKDAHTLDSFNRFSENERPVQILNSEKIGDGIYEIKYKVAKLNKGKPVLNADGTYELVNNEYVKTITDTMKLDNNKLVYMAKEAFTSRNVYITPGKQIYINGITKKGVKFEGWINQITKELESFCPVKQWKFEY